MCLYDYLYVAELLDQPGKQSVRIDFKCIWQSVRLLVAILIADISWLDLSRKYFDFSGRVWHVEFRGDY